MSEGGEVAGSVMILKIEVTASPATFAVLKNQVSLSISGDSVMADTTSKGGSFESGKAVLLNDTIDFEYNVDPTDQAHIDLQTIREALGTVNIELVREDGSGKYAGSYSIAKLGPTSPVTDIVRYSGQLVPATDPTLT